MSSAARVQNLRECSVRIFHTRLDEPDGTGIAVRDRAGQIVIATCAHVAQTALNGTHPRDAGDQEVGVYFPQVRGPEAKERRAKVICCLPDDYDDDIVLLRLTGDDPAPLAPEQIAVLGHAEASEGNPFRSYGYAPVADALSFWVDGRIQGYIEIKDARLQVPLVMLRSESKEGFMPGMSGAAVLDMERNLIVGLISDRWKPSAKERSDIGWSLDAHVLTFDPFNLELRDDPLPLRDAPQPKVENIAATRALAAATPGFRLEGAPEPLPEWVGRDTLLAALDADWRDPAKHVTGLIGFGGEGKSSLARQWLTNLLNDQTQRQPDGVFWWSFYDRRNIDEFFEAAINYLGGGVVDPRQIPSATAKAQVIGAMLGARCYLFVLDGLEVMQNQEGDRYGQITNTDLRELLAYFAGPGHDSFCLITSRAPLPDLLEYQSYTPRDVDRLSDDDGRDLLRKIGVKGPDAALDRLVGTWDGHALTVSLIGSLLVKEHGGDVTRAELLPPPEADENRYQRVHRVLRRYDEHLDAAERAFMMLFSAFRTPVKESAFEKVFRTTTRVTSLNAPVAALSEVEFRAMVGRLTQYRVMRYSPDTQEYTTHPLIRNYYFALLSRRKDAKKTHVDIANYYLSVAPHPREVYTPRGWQASVPTMDDLLPLIEAVHHACRARAYDKAEQIRWEHIDQGNRHVLVHQLGAYETELGLMLEFFPGGNTSKDPVVSRPSDKSWILNETGLCMMNLGRLAEAVLLYERANVIKLTITKDWLNASIGYWNLATLRAYLGNLSAAADAARQALVLARRAEAKEYELKSLAWQAWFAHLRGDVASADMDFRQAEALEREIDPDKRYLYSLDGIQHADHLRRTGASDYARRVGEANVTICEHNHFGFLVSQCHRVLGDLDADAGQHESARGHYDAALKIARSISFRSARIEVLLARGRLYAKHQHDAHAAFSDLNEALGYITESGYRIFEADCHVALAWAHRAAGDPVFARSEAERAKTMSAQMGYHWGQVDADEVLTQIGAS